MSDGRERRPIPDITVVKDDEGGSAYVPFMLMDALKPQLSGVTVAAVTHSVVAVIPNAKLQNLFMIIEGRDGCF